MSLTRKRTSSNSARESELEEARDSPSNGKVEYAVGPGKIGAIGNQKCMCTSNL